MSQKDFSRKHPTGKTLNEALTRAVKTRATEGEIPCAVAFEIAAESNTPPGEVGFTMDALNVKVVKCQLGLYGYKPNKKVVRAAETVSAELEKAIRNSINNSRLSCAAAWRLAETLNLRKMQIAEACEALGIKISDCQLGGF